MPRNFLKLFLAEQVNQNLSSFLALRLKFLRQGFSANLYKQQPAFFARNMLRLKIRTLKFLSLSQMNFVCFCTAIFALFNQVSTSIVHCEWTHDKSLCDSGIEDSSLR